MRYRDFGSTGAKHSVLGFGAMRLPHEKGDSSRIREDQAIEMIRRAVDGGVTYVDTAYGYHGGNSEALVAKALRDGLRSKVAVADKLPVWLAHEPSDFEKLLSTQLERLNDERIDVYLLHSLNRDSWRRVRDMGVLDFLVKERERGRIGFLGFSFHDSYEVFVQIVDAFEWDMCQIMLNYVDVEYQAGLAGLQYAAAKGMAVVVMEPLRGGKLAAGLPPEVSHAFSQVHPEWTPAEWGLKAVLDWPEVSVVLSGMSDMDQVEENLRIASESFPGSLGPAEREALQRARQVFMDRVRILCTQCGYCHPCPEGVAIPQVFGVYNKAYMFDDRSGLVREYRDLVQSQKDASHCARCGRCESVCPQGLEVISLLEKVYAEVVELMDKADAGARAAHKSV
ncbi:MAG: aldo/keto reductase [Firmicutes bacterium]|jgi:predicted aldo/keto reductase-like oxidoreductase|nr:aldo/keto reductase [Bacillota bacterium]